MPPYVISDYFPQEWPTISQARVHARATGERLELFDSERFDYATDTGASHGPMWTVYPDGSVEEL